MQIVSQKQLHSILFFYSSYFVIGVFGLLLLTSLIFSRDRLHENACNFLLIMSDSKRRCNLLRKWWKRFGMPLLVEFAVPMSIDKSKSFRLTDNQMAKECFQKENWKKNTRKQHLYSLINVLWICLLFKCYSILNICGLIISVAANKRSIFLCVRMMMWTIIDFFSEASSHWTSVRMSTQ